MAIRVPQTFLPSQQSRESRQPPRAQEPTSKLAKRKREEQKAAAAPAAAAKKAKAVANDEELSELEDDGSDADEDLEEAYERKLAALGSDDDDADTAKAPVVLRPTLALEDLMDVDEGSSEGVAGAGLLVHESVVKASKAAPGKLSKTQAKKAGKLPVWTPEGETQDQRDSRTLFIGNLSAEVAKDKVRHEDGRRSRAADR